MKILYSLLFVILLLISAAFLFGSQFYSLNSKKEILPAYEAELKRLGMEALKSNDVPVSAVFIYDNKIIGKGFNTVIRDSNAGGHAEINAISDAIKKAGLNQFLNFDRKKTKIISTFEPCPMCKGAIQEYGIKEMEFLKEKSFMKNFKVSLGGLFYEFNKSQAESHLQDSLFLLHPDYKEQTQIIE